MIAGLGVQPYSRALLAARQRAAGPGGGARSAGRVRVHQGHSSLRRRPGWPGCGRPSACSYGLATGHALDVALPGWRPGPAVGGSPAFVVATTGTTSTPAFDPVAGVGEAATRHGAWLASTARGRRGRRLPRVRSVTTGSSGRQLPFRPAQVAVRQLRLRAASGSPTGRLIGALSVLPEYLRNAATRRGRSSTIATGRRRRAPLPGPQALVHPAVLRRRGLRLHVREHVALAGRVGTRRWRPTNASSWPHRPLSLVCLRHRDGDETNAEGLDDLNLQVGGLPHPYPPRRTPGAAGLAVGATGTEQRHVEAAWRLITQLAPPWTGPSPG